MDERFDLQKYLTEGVEQVIKDALKAILKDPSECAFLVKFAASCAVADKRREKNEKEGLHVPSYLIASITSSCNLHCEGCYSRANDATTDCAPSMQLTEEEWTKTFREAEELGVSFILLAGGEPMLRWDVIESAGKMKNIMFPVFTNGTFMTDRHLELLEKCRNIVPVISIEGEREETDTRRGTGVYDTVMEKMDELHEMGIKTIGIPGTIDNDIASSDFTIGFSTALNTACEAIDKLRDTSSSHQRCSIIEVMGRHCGDLALYSGICCGAEYIITNESGLDKDDLLAKLKANRLAGRKHAIVVISENMTDVYQLAKEVETYSGYECRATVLGYVQRGGAPTPEDRLLAARLGKYSVDLLHEGVTGVAVGVINNKLRYTPIEEALAMKNEPNEELHKLVLKIS